MRFLASIFAAALSIAACGDARRGPMPFDQADALLGGDATVFDDSRDAFGRASPNLAPSEVATFTSGESIFRRTWVAAPSLARDGLGPTFNAASCSACHFKNGRGAPPVRAGEPMVGLVLRLGVPGSDEHGAPIDETNYGGQFNPLSVAGVPSEGSATVSYEEVPGAFSDGERFSLRRPTYSFSYLAFGPLDLRVRISPRIAPPTIGLGLLEFVEEARLLAGADPEDTDHDGISGRANYVWSPRVKARALGRFGWKANHAGLEEQTAAAFFADIGITTSLRSEENCPEVQTACAQAPSGGATSGPEASDVELSEIAAYQRTLAVPARRSLGDVVIWRGETLFEQAQCAGCHTPLLKTGDAPGFPPLARQTIRPFTDLLLHDMGDELADGMVDGEASGREWRTAPLWGIGLTSTVSRHEFFLHDGRARGLAEAILWHGGEASSAREKFRTMSREDRVALLRFLSSL